MDTTVRFGHSKRGHSQDPFYDTHRPGTSEGIRGHQIHRSRSSASRSSFSGERRLRGSEGMHLAAGTNKKLPPGPAPFAKRVFNKVRPYLRSNDEDKLTPLQSSPVRAQSAVDIRRENRAGMITPFRPSRAHTPRLLEYRQNVPSHQAERQVPGSPMRRHEVVTLTASEKRCDSPNVQPVTPDAQPGTPAVQSEPLHIQPDNPSIQLVTAKVQAVAVDVQLDSFPRQPEGDAMAPAKPPLAEELDVVVESYNKLKQELFNTKKALEESKKRTEEVEANVAYWQSSYDSLEKGQAQLEKEKNHLLSDLETQKTENAKLIENHSRELEERNGKIERLQAKISDAASKAAHIPRHLALQRPQHEIINSWLNLGYSVNNLVANDLDARSHQKLVSWLKLEEVQLARNEIMSSSLAITTRNGEYLVQAVLWDALYKAVFGSFYDVGSVTWAGRYGGKFRNLGASLVERALQTDTTLPMFHQWKALTTNLVKVVDPGESRNSNVADITEDLVQLFEPLRHRTRRDTLRSSLRRIVESAVELDEILWGQEEWYFVRYPEKRFDFIGDRSSMVSIDERAISRRVLMVVRPGLFCNGVDGKNYLHNGMQLDKHRVYMEK